MLALPCGRFAGKALHQIGQLQQVADSQKRSSITHDDLRIGAHKISPLWRNRPNGGIAGLEQKAFAVPVVPPANTRQWPCK